MEPHEDGSPESSEEETHANSPAQNPRNDLGGLGGNAPTPLVLKPPTPAERRLKAHIRFFKNKYPHIDINKHSELDHALLGLNESELKDIVETCKSQIGGMPG